jgi:FAD/FMN-containing dehydrogenase
VKNVPRRAAGPDIRQVVIGNEGALCFITEVTVKLHRYLPENTEYRGFLIDEFDDGLAVIRGVVTGGYRPSVCRVYSEEDAYLSFGDVHQGKCVLVFVCEGPKPIAAATAAEIDDAMAGYECERLDPRRVEEWFADLNWGVDKILAEQQWMLEQRNLGYTTEISANWSDVSAIYKAVMQRIRGEFPFASDLKLLGAHSSHSYPTGTNLYFVYDYDVNCDPREEITKYHIPLNAIIVEEALKRNGSMVHHHGIGKYRTPWTEEEHGSAYYMLRKLKDAFDPNGIMNKGTIFPAP